MSPTEDTQSQRSNWGQVWLLETSLLSARGSLGSSACWISRARPGGPPGVPELAEGREWPSVGWFFWKGLCETGAGAPGAGSVESCWRRAEKIEGKDATRDAQLKELERQEGMDHPLFTFIPGSPVRTPCWEPQRRGRGLLRIKGVPKAEKEFLFL